MISVHVQFVRAFLASSSGGYILGFRVDPADRLEEVHHELHSLHQIYSVHPIFGIDYVEEEKVRIELKSFRVGYVWVGLKLIFDGITAKTAGRSDNKASSGRTISCFKREYLFSFFFFIMIIRFFSCEPFSAVKNGATPSLCANPTMASW